MKARVITPILALGAALSGFADGLWSDSTFVFTRPEESFLWRTATNASLRLVVPYPAGATTADLTIRQKGQVVVEQTDLTEAFADVSLPAPTSPEAEGVYDLTLTFDKGSPLTASLAVVAGAGAGDEWLMTRCLGTSERRWKRIGSSAVLPIPYGTTELRLNGQVVETGLDRAAGWYAWGPLDAEAVAGGASLTVEGVDDPFVVDAFHYGIDGLLLIFR